MPATQPKTFHVKVKQDRNAVFHGTVYGPGALVITPTRHDFLLAAKQLVNSTIIIDERGTEVKRDRAVKIMGEIEAGKRPLIASSNPAKSPTMKDHNPKIEQQGSGLTVKEMLEIDLNKVKLKDIDLMNLADLQGISNKLKLGKFPLNSKKHEIYFKLEEYLLQIELVQEEAKKANEQYMANPDDKTPSPVPPDGATNPAIPSDGSKSTAIKPEGAPSAVDTHGNLQGTVEVDKKGNITGNVQEAEAEEEIEDDETDNEEDEDGEPEDEDGEEDTPKDQEDMEDDQVDEPEAR